MILLNTESTNICCKKTYAETVVSQEQRVTGWHEYRAGVSPSSPYLLITQISLTKLMYPLSTQALAGMPTKDVTSRYTFLLQVVRSRLSVTVGNNALTENVLIHHALLWRVQESGYAFALKYSKRFAKITFLMSFPYWGCRSVPSLAFGCISVSHYNLKCRKTIT